jgi:hypothetical protein
MSLAGSEPAILVGERAQTNTLDRAATGTGHDIHIKINFTVVNNIINHSHTTRTWEQQAFCIS